MSAHPINHKDFNWTDKEIIGHQLVVWSQKSPVCMLIKLHSMWILESFS